LVIAGEVMGMTGAYWIVVAISILAVANGQRTTVITS
jgi:hypothetical protein